MTIALAETRGRRFLFQIFALGLFSRLVQILAILCLLNLNDYFTTAAQIPYLLPAASLILLLLILVGLAESRISLVCNQLIQRLTLIHKILGLHLQNSADESSPQEQRDFLKNVFLPTIIHLPAAPIVAFFLVTSTPQLFVISLVQAAVNTGLVYRYNELARRQVSAPSVRPRLPSSQVQLASDQKTHVLRRGTLEKAEKGFLNSEAENESLESGMNEYPASRRKKDALRLSNLVFRGLILVTSAVLAIYKISSLGSIVGYFILNNTLRYAVVILAEYIFPVGRHLSFNAACMHVNLALQAEQILLEIVEKRQRSVESSHQAFDRRMADRLNRKPFMRFNEFRVVCGNGISRTIVDGITARLELQPITLIHVSGVHLSKDLEDLIDDRFVNRMHVSCHGISVCGQLALDAQFWQQLPIYAYWHNRIADPSLQAHFALEHRPQVVNLIEKYDLKRFYLEGEIEPSQLQDFSRRQLNRMRALLAWFDLLLEPHQLAVIPFAFDLFDESEALQLLQILSENKQAESRSLLLLSRPLAIGEQWRCFELKRGSLRKMS